MNPAVAAQETDWPQVRRWRRAERDRLLSLRLALPAHVRRRASADVSLLLMAEMAGRLGDVVALYWPIRGEIDLRPLAVRLHAVGVATALPVVVAPGQPLEFWRWAPDTELRRGVWQIPVPAERRPLRPTAVVAPLLGHDLAGYRLGYGGGYYDRTLADMASRPLIVGVGHGLGRLASIRPQAHDVPMDVVVTETAVQWRRRAAAADRRMTRPAQEEAPDVR